MSTATSRDPIPTRALRTSFIWLSHRKALGRLSTRIPITRPMVRRFIAGESLPEVLPALERLRDAGYLTTVDVLGESVDSADACGLAAGRYEETLDALAARGLERNVSLKLTQMGLDIDRDLCRDTVARVFRKAAERGRLRADRHGGPHEDGQDARPLARAAAAQPGERGRHPGGAPPVAGRRRDAHRRGCPRPPLQGRLQRADLGRPARARGDQRRLRGAGAAADGRRRSTRPSPRTTGGSSGA